ncbi:putative EndonucleaseReverse transcriptase [Phytophthora cinnamomi]|uniref:putative EndonucleaseReverse transcriptase n=1 Tax=Phytophthora cinnamomi TaxID=4785 RepID=UPI0035597FCC|nr:putative EndonucleaseReverse transcriptase [Phytophthora cinnamomi]
MSRAFDTIDRAKLMDVLRSFLDDDEVRLIQLLLPDTTLSLRSGSTTLNPFTSNLGTPQGDSLSPVLFIVYLEAVLRDLADSLDVGRAFLDDMIVYADNADFVCRTVEATAFIQDQAPAILARWSLAMNSSKTELTAVARASTSTPTRHVRAQEEAWRDTKKLGSLLGDAEDVSRRKQLARAALNRMWTLWLRTSSTSERTRVRLYNSYVLPILLYNCGTWALTKGDVLGLESFHRRQLRQVVGVRYPQRISNAALYKRCNARLLRYRITKARWALFGQVLRGSDRNPEFMQMARCFDSSTEGGWRGRPAPRYQRSWIKTFAIPSKDAGSAPKLTFSRFVPKHKTRPSGRNSWEP